MKKLLVIGLVLITACHKPKPAEPVPTPSAQQKRAARAAEVPEPIQRHWTFLNRIRQKEEYSQQILRTMLNEQDQLGVVLYSTVAPDAVPALMEKMMTEMGTEFPQEDVTVAVYRVAKPPEQIGTAHVDGKTGAATYTAR